MLYKYVSINSKSYKSILLDRQVYFASPRQLNDPFEFRPHYKKPSKGKLKRYLMSLGADHAKALKLIPEAMHAFDSNLELMDELIFNIQQKSGVLCLTPHNDSLLMWSHYGNSHRGVCIGFDIQLPFDNEFGHGYPVEYQEEYPTICMTEIDSMQRDIRHGRNMSAHDNITTRGAFTKSTVWRYEEEVRFYRSLSEGPGLMEFSSHKLKEVIIGASFPEENFDELKQIIRKVFPNALLKKAHLSKDKYKLEIKDLQ